jgi:uncharacterized protein (TIGR03083 family)
VTIETWAQVRSERLGLADEIDTLGAEAWATPSLCSGWRVADVAGHLVFLAEGSLLRGAWHRRSCSPLRPLGPLASAPFCPSTVGRLTGVTRCVSGLQRIDASAISR